MIRWSGLAHYLDVLFRFRRTEPGAAVPSRSASGSLRLRRIFDETHDLAWRLLRRCGVPAELMEDGVQQVFLITAERLDDIRPGSESAFVYGVALRVSRTLMRRRAREILGDEPDLHTSLQPGAETLLGRKRLVEQCDRILDRLSPELREVFVMHEIEGLSGAAVAQVIGIPAGTVSSRLRRARQLFRAEVEALALASSTTEVHGG